MTELARITLAHVQVLKMLDGYHIARRVHQDSMKAKLIIAQKALNEAQAKKDLATAARIEIHAPEQTLSLTSSLDMFIDSCLKREQKEDRGVIKDYVLKVLSDKDINTQRKQVFKKYFPDSDRETEEYIIPHDPALEIVSKWIFQHNGVVPRL